jgi:hypothetical protein
LSAHGIPLVDGDATAQKYESRRIIPSDEWGTGGRFL